MKPLFTVPERANKSKDLSVAKKSNRKSKASNSQPKGGVRGTINTIRAKVEANLGKYKDDYITISDQKTLHDYIEQVICNGVIAIDTETTGLDPMQDELVGISIYTPGQKAAYIPINHISFVTGVRSNGQLTPEAILEEFNIISAHKDIVEIIMFNACFDIRVLRHGIGWKDVYCTWDCYLGARLMNENEPETKLKPLYKKYCLDGVGDAFTFEGFFKGITFNKIPIDIAYLYAAHDAEITYIYYEFQKPYLTPTDPLCKEYELEDVAWIFKNIEMPCVPVVAEMEDTGVDLDLEYCQQLSEKYHAIEQEKLQRFYNLLDMYEEEITKYRLKNPDSKLDTPINVDSPAQLSVLLYDILKVPSLDKKKPRGTGEDILQKLKSDKRVKPSFSDIADAILDYRGVAKLISTYIDKMPECLNPDDNRVHCKFNQYGAKTGRFSSQDPNLQNIPSHNKDIRKMFKATDGYVMMSSDYSQQEPKVMTEMCQDEKMIQAYKEGKDLYAEIAALSFNTTYNECVEHFPKGSYIKYHSGKWHYGTENDYDKIADGENDVYSDGKNRRSQAKSILLGVLYGRGVLSIAEQLETTAKKAQEIKDSVFKGFPAIPKFEADSLHLAEEKGYVTTLWGRKRRLPILQSPKYTFSWLDGSPRDDDPLDFGEDSQIDTEVPYEIQEKYLRKLAYAKFNQKRTIFEQANNEGIYIVDNSSDIAEAQRQCVNARIQGSAADMTKIAMINIGNNERLKELGFRLLIQVHDELIAECPKENVKEASEIFARLMSEAAVGKLSIPINCDVEITDRWYGVKYEYDDIEQDIQ